MGFVVVVDDDDDDDDDDDVVPVAEFIVINSLLELSFSSTSSSLLFVLSHTSSHSISWPPCCAEIPYCCIDRKVHYKTCHAPRTLLIHRLL